MWEEDKWTTLDILLWKIETHNTEDIECIDSSDDMLYKQLAQTTGDLYLSPRPLDVTLILIHGMPYISAWQKTVGLGQFK